VSGLADCQHLNPAPARRLLLEWVGQTRSLHQLAIRQRIFQTHLCPLSRSAVNLECPANACHTLPHVIEAIAGTILIGWVKSTSVVFHGDDHSPELTPHCHAHILSTRVLGDVALSFLRSQKEIVAGYCRQRQRWN